MSEIVPAWRGPTSPARAPSCVQSGIALRFSCLQLWTARRKGATLSKENTVLLENWPWPLDPWTVFTSPVLVTFHGPVDREGILDCNAKKFLRGGHHFRVKL